MSNNKIYPLRIDVKILELLGPSLYTSIYYVLAELVANAYDASAENVYIIIRDNEIIVEDDGTGMSYDKDITKYLGVAEETRVTEADSIIKVGSIERRKMGRKGIGKLAALSVSENVLVKTIKNKDKSGFILSRKVDKSKNLKPLSDNEISFEKISNHGTAIVMQEPQYDIHKTIKAIKNNLIKFFPMAGEMFKVHIVTTSGTEIIDDFNTSMITGLGSLITLGDKYKFLSRHFNFDSFIEKENHKNLLKKKEVFCKTIILKNKDGKEKKYILKIEGWIGTYKTISRKKSTEEDFPDNFISLLSNDKLGEFNILPSVGKERLLESYVIGQLHVDLFEETELPDMSLSNRQGYKDRDPRYIAVIDHVREKLLPEILKMRNLYADYKKAGADKIKKDANLRKEEELISAAKKYKKKASNAVISGLSNFINKDDASAKKIIDEAINNTTELMGIKKEVDEAKKKILISHANIEKKDKLLSDLICQMLEFNNVPKDKIIYTSSDEEEHREPDGEDILDYLREFFVDTMSTDKIYVLYITSEEMSKRWNAVLEVGAGWITQGSHKIFNILDYDSETPHYEPQSPLKRGPRWHTSKIKDGIIHMDELSFDLFCVQMRTICEAINIVPKSKNANKTELTRLNVRDDLTLNFNQ
ncbi:FIG00774806: hypothetical protein [uncultured Gammaproteobacteria bacterium]|nr:FIG00774806: hypothetical protein [uncultured Gammaproteobacteria bacterium]VVH65567.1 FIG00774806: hypothetical protein [uncultured Gammaproteobacteria bacterium]